MEKYTSKDIIERLEFVRNKALEQNQKDDIEYWQKCRRLTTTVNSEGWGDAVDLLRGYVIYAVERLVSIDPAEKDNAAAQHGVAHVASHLVRIFTEDVQKMVNHSRETPQVIKETNSTQLEL